MTIKILAFLQNQWFKDPEGVKAMMEEHPDRRERYIKAFLFMGCLTGKRLRSALGEELCDSIVWEEISPEIGGHSASKFPPDLPHIRKVIEKHSPDIVLAFGALAKDGVRFVCCDTDVKHPCVMFAPHPAARGNPMPELKALGETLRAATASALP